MDVLVVGAGAVGAVYAHHLAKGGARVSFFVREARRAEAARPIALHRVPLLVGRRRTERFVPRGVLATLAEVREQRFDAAWICTPSDALDASWLDPLVAALGDATIVGLQPGDAAGRVLAASVPRARLVRGTITMISWHTPLEGSTDPRERGAEPGYAYLLPGPTRFAGERAATIAASLARGRAPARGDPRADDEVAFSSAVLLPHVAALEAASWSFAALAKSELARVAVEASREAVQLVARERSIAVPVALRLVRPWITRLALWWIPRLAPFDVETYFRVHFTKVGTQTRAILRDQITSAAAHQLPADALVSLEIAVLRRADPRLPAPA